MRTSIPENFSTSQGTVIEDFADLSPFTITGGSVVTSNYISNQDFRYAAKATGNPASDLTMTRALAQSFVLNSITRLMLPVNIIDSQYTANIKIQFSSDGFASKSATKTFTGTDYVGNSNVNGDYGDNTLVVTPGDWTLNNGQLLTDTMTHMRIIFHSGTGLSGVVYIGQIRKNFDSGTKIIFIWDDENLTQYTVSYPKMEAYGFKGTIAFANTFLGQAGYMSIAQLLDIQDNKGWDICSHTRDHVNFSTLTQAEQELQISTNKQIMLANGFTSAPNFVILPQGGHNTSTPPALANQGVLACRDGRIGVQHVN